MVKAEPRKHMVSFGSRRVNRTNGCFLIVLACLGY